MGERRGFTVVILPQVWRTIVHARGVVAGLVVFALYAHACKASEHVILSAAGAKDLLLLWLWWQRQVRSGKQVLRCAQQQQVLRCARVPRAPLRACPERSEGMTASLCC